VVSVEILEIVLVVFYRSPVGGMGGPVLEVPAAGRHSDYPLLLSRAT
jgi:hypothetical protein